MKWIYCSANRWWLLYTRIRSALEKCRVICGNGQGDVYEQSGQLAISRGRPHLSLLASSIFLNELIMPRQSSKLLAMGCLSDWHSLFTCFKFPDSPIIMKQILIRWRKSGKIRKAHESMPRRKRRQIEAAQFYVNLIAKYILCIQPTLINQNITP